MTGYGRATCEVESRRLVIETRSVNHRFLEVKVRLPFQDAGLEAQVTQEVRRRIDRGVISVSVREDSGRSQSEVRVNVELGRVYKQELERLRSTLGIEGAVTLDMVAAQPGVLQASEGYADSDKVWSGIKPGLEGALTALIESRTREGKALVEDLGTRMGALEKLVGDIRALAKDAPDLYRRRLHERIERLMQNGEVDPHRVAQEVAIFADRVDVTEELTRLDTHVAELRRLFSETGPTGRRLDFLVQELNREVNTIGSKSQSAPIAQRVVEAKAELERLREQIQNVE
jgi:uncharacterized protein (TIGR00255 family)